MSSVHGINTGQLGAWLTRHVSGRADLQHYRVYYDHGSPVEANVAAVKGFYGETVSNRNRLADIDLLVATPDGEIVLLLEIEETFSSPKKLLGDVVAILMCNRVAVKQDGQQMYFTPSPTTHLLVAGLIPAKGQKLAQLEQIVKPRLQQFATPSDAIPLQNVDFLFRGDMSTTIDALKEYVVALLEQARKDKFGPLCVD